MCGPFSCGVISTLRNQEEGTADRTYCILLDCICSWGHVGHVLELVFDWLPEEPPQSKVGVFLLRSAGGGVPGLTALLLPVSPCPSG